MYYLTIQSIRQSFALDVESSIKLIFQKKKNIKNKVCRELWFWSTLSYLKKNVYQVWIHLNLWCQSSAPKKKHSIQSIRGGYFKSKTRLSYVSYVLHILSLQETCRSSLVIWTYGDNVILRIRGALYTYQLKGNNSKLKLKAYPHNNIHSWICQLLR